MITYCAWCGIQLRASSEDGAPTGRDSHGICPDCAATLLSESGTPVGDFLRGLGVPVFLVSGDVEVLDVNAAALDMVGREADAVLGRLGGEVFECVHAGLPEGCGRTVHCSGCALRQTVMATFRTGTPYVQVPATLKARATTEPETVDLLITTIRVAGSVLLKVEPAR